MMTTLLKPDSVVMGMVVRDDTVEARPTTEAKLLLDRNSWQAGQTIDIDTVERVPASDASEVLTCLPTQDANAGMTDDDTVSILEVLDEMQRIIDRHLEKTAQQQSDP